jgi:aminopeptidase-like protein
MIPNIGDEIHQWASDLFPICRSISGDGVRNTLAYLKNLLPQLEIYEIPSGSNFFDWTIPNEWNIEEAWIENEKGDRILDFANNNLHVVGYSEPIDKLLSFKELQKKLHSREDLPDAIPYIASVYERDWGFCLSHGDRQKLQDGNYRCVIKSTLEKGSLTFAEVVLPGADPREILISTYADHPSMANNELSGPLVAVAIGRWLSKINRKYTYRILIAPETIGAIVNIAKYGDIFKERLMAGFVLTCIGDDRGTSVVHSPYGNTLADRVANHVLRYTPGKISHYDFLDRGSDERQYCGPGIRLPVVTLCRTKFGEFPEYHTSLDNLTDVVTPKGLQGGFDYVVNCIEILESNSIWQSKYPCEPRMGKIGLYPNVMSHKIPVDTVMLMNLLAYLDGESDLLEVAEKINLPFKACLKLLEILEQNNLIVKNDSKKQS